MVCLIYAQSVWEPIDLSVVIYSLQAELEHRASGVDKLASLQSRYDSLNARSLAQEREVTQLRTENETINRQKQELTVQFGVAKSDAERARAFGSEKDEECRQALEELRARPTEEEVE